MPRNNNLVLEMVILEKCDYIQDMWGFFFLVLRCFHLLYILYTYIWSSSVMFIVIHVPLYHYWHYTVHSIPYKIMCPIHITCDHVQYLFPTYVVVVYAVSICCYVKCTLLAVGAH